MELGVDQAKPLEEDAKIVKITVDVADDNQTFQWLVDSFRGVRIKDTDCQQQEGKGTAGLAEKGASRTVQRLARCISRRWSELGWSHWLRHAGVFPGTSGMLGCRV